MPMNPPVVASRPSSSLTSRRAHSSGVSAVSRKPATRPHQCGGLPTPCTSTTRPARSTIAPTTGTGLHQWTKPHLGHPSRSWPPCTPSASSVRERGQYWKSPCDGAVRLSDCERLAMLGTRCASISPRDARDKRSAEDEQDHGEHVLGKPS